MAINLDEQGSFMQGRVLGKGKKWLGEPLERGGLNEINERSVAELGFKWFDDAPGNVLAKYVDNIGRDIQRTFFVDELFRLAPDQIAPIVEKVVPNRTIAKGVEKAMTRWTKLLNTYNRRITGDTGSVYSESAESLNNILDGARKIVDDAFEQSEEARAAVRGLREEVDAQLEELEKLRTYAASAGEGLRRDYEAYVGPLERQLRDFRAALDSGEGERFAAREWLLARHAELFPDAVTRPSQPQQLANQIIRELERVLGGAARTSAVAKTTRQALTTRPDIIVDVAGQNMALPVVRKEVGRLSRAVSAAKNKFDRLMKADPDLQEYDNAVDQFNKVASRFDTAAAVAGERSQWEQTFGEMYREDIASIERILAELPGPPVRETVKDLSDAELIYGAKAMLEDGLDDPFGLQRYMDWSDASIEYSERFKPVVSTWRICLRIWLPLERKHLRFRLIPVRLLCRSGCVRHAPHWTS
jgi:hypothetical protein